MEIRERYAFTYTIIGHYACWKYYSPAFYYYS